MFDAVREGKIARFFVILIFGVIIISFSFWGVETYVRGIGSSDGVATVDGSTVSSQEFNTAYRNQLDQLRNMLGQSFDPSMMDNPEAKRGVLEGVINQRVLGSAARRVGLAIPDSQLRLRISEVPAFQDNGQFSLTRFQQFARSQGMTEVGLEERVREDLLLQQMRGTIVETAFVPKFQVESFARINDQQREVSHVTLAPKQFESAVKTDAAAVKTYYDTHTDEFKIAEQVKLEYVMLSAEKFAADMPASDQEIKEIYDQRVKQGQYTKKANTSDAEKKPARTKAEQVLKEVKADPDKFANLAKKYSQDTGSAAQGGDLGVFGRGAMVKPFEEAVFSMKPGEVRGPIESEFGYHIIKLAEIKGEARKASHILISFEERTQTLDEVKKDIAIEIKKQKAGKKYTEAAEKFNDMVFTQSDSLKPVVDEFKLVAQQSDYIPRTGAGANPLLANKKLLDAAFSDEVLKNKRNTEAIEVGPNMLIAARVIGYKPAAQKPYAEASAAIQAKLKQEEAAKLVTKKGQEDLEQLKQGKELAGLSWSKPQLVSRKSLGDLPPVTVNPVFKADAKKLPVYLGTANQDGGYTLVKISKVVEAAAADEAKRKATAEQLQQGVAQNEFGAALKSLRGSASVKISQSALGQKLDR
jgi:peptidyl-prolyl cis-trans isomerase D